MMLPDGWKQGRLGGLCSIEIGGTPSRGVAAYWDSAHDTSNVWVSIRDMRQRLITRSAEQISNLGVKKSNVKLQHPGTVLLSFKLSIGRVAIAAVPLFTNEAIAGLSPTGLTRDFLFHGLQGWDLLRGADQAIKGATLNKQKLKNILFEYPESEREQAKIAEVLSTVDRTIEETEALIAKRQRIKTGLMQDLLTRGIDEHGNLRSEQTHKFKDSPLGRIPVEWDVTLLDSLAVRGSGHTPNKQRPAYWNGGIKWVSLADSRKLDDLYISETDKEISELGLRNSSAVLHPAGTVILSRDAGVGKSAILAHEMAVSQHFMAWRCKSTKLDNIYLYYWLQRDKPQFEGIASGSTIVTIGLQFFLSYLVAAPCEVDEQIAISTQLETADFAIAQTTLLSRKLGRLKTALMQDLLTGNRRVTALLEQRQGVTR